MTKKFTVLRVIAWILRILGAAVLVVAFIAGIAGIVAGITRGFGFMGHYGAGRMMGFGMGFGYFLSGLLGGIVLYGAGEVVDLLLAIEENTRIMRVSKSVQVDVPAKPTDSNPDPVA